MAGVLTQRAVAESRGHSSPVDWAGAAFFTASAAALTYALIHGGGGGWDTAATLAAFAVAVAALLAFLAVERRRAHPLLDLALFRRCPSPR